MKVADYWQTEDVKSLDPNLSDDRANAALLLATNDYFDASIGVNWESLEAAIRALAPFSEEDCQVVLKRHADKIIEE